MRLTAIAPIGHPAWELPCAGGAALKKYIYIYMIQMNLFMKQKQSDIENRLVVAKREGSVGGKEWEFGISRCKVLHTDWISNKVLLRSTENYIQYPLINYNGKEYEKEYIYIYITESHCINLV